MMPKQNYIPAKIFCQQHQVEYSFIRDLTEYGLVTLTVIEENECVPENSLPALEKYIRLHNDLHINVEGIEAISHLLNRIESMQQELISLKNKLDRYR